MKKTLIIAALISVSVAGCKKPETVANLSVQGTGNFPTNIAQLTSISANAYANLRSENLYGWNVLIGAFATSEHIADETGPLNRVDQFGVAAYNNPPVNAQWVVNIWNGYYIGIRETNTTIEAADFYMANYGSEADQQQVNYIKGESYFLRAWYYLQLECFFGQKYIDIKQPAAADADILGVPLFTNVAKSLDETSKPRATAREVWNQITSDLKKAAELLDGVNWSQTNKGRATDIAAKALLGKAYVFTQNWDSAKLYLKDVIDNPAKSLMPFSQYRQSFNSNMRGNALNNHTLQEFNQESLFEINVDRVPGNGGYGIFGNSPNLYLTTSMGLFWSPSGFKDDGRLPFRMGYSTEYVHDRNLLRFGFVIPVDSIKASTLIPNQDFNPNAVGYVSTVNLPSEWYTDSSKSLRNNKYADPRLYVCALEPYFDTVYFSGNLNPSNRKLRPVSKCVNLPVPDSYHGWSFKKYQTLDASLDETDVTQSDASNYYLLRLADVYLLYAEACLNTGDDANALLYINKIHRRAYGYDINSSSPYDYESLNDRTVADPSDVNLANNPLAFERYSELFAEGHWWFDVGRWGNSVNASGPLYNVQFGKNEATYYGNLLPGNIPSQWETPKSYTYPIPTAEVTANAKLAAQPNHGQNPGY
ncbi:MAG: RagB/SusD family nutrient uptake outer membrane protein [Ferruginibacter sp.]